MRAFEKRVKNSEWRGFHCNRSSHFFIPFVSWFYLGYTIKVTKSETLYLKYKYKNKGIKYLFSVISHVFEKTIHLSLDVDKCQYDLYYCEANSFAVIQWVHIFAQVIVSIV